MGQTDLIIVHRSFIIILGTIVFVLLGIGLLGYLAARKKVRRLEKEKAKLEKEILLREQFTGVAAHELKNPLTVVKMYANLMVKKKEREGEIIGYEAEKINRMIDTLFSYSKLAHGKFPVRKEEFDLAALLTRRINSFHLVYPDRHIELIIAVPSAMVTTDWGAVDQIVTNLLTNAIRYSGKTITVRLVKKRHVYVIEVEDQGDGIPEQVKEVLWDAFAKSSQQGLGLGLFIVKKLSEAINAEIGYCSTTKGTCFSLTLQQRGGEVKNGNV